VHLLRIQSNSTIEHPNSLEHSNKLGAKDSTTRTSRSRTPKPSGKVQVDAASCSIDCSCCCAASCRHGVCGFGYRRLLLCLPLVSDAVCAMLDSPCLLHLFCLCCVCKISKPVSRCSITTTMVTRSRISESPNAIVLSSL
jgi:hypothetical protein